MDLEEAKKINEFRLHCIKHCFQGSLWVYDKLFSKALKIIKKEEKKLRM